MGIGNLNWQIILDILQELSRRIFSIFISKVRTTNIATTIVICIVLTLVLNVQSRRSRNFWYCHFLKILPPPYFIVPLWMMSVMNWWYCHHFHSPIKFLPQKIDFLYFYRLLWANHCEILTLDELKTSENCCIFFYVFVTYLL